MQTSRFQLGLIAALAIGLGYTLSSAQAVGYPAGAAVSYGANPVVSVGGLIDDATITLISAPADQDLVITDLLLTMYVGNCNSSITLTNSAGDTVAQVRLKGVEHRGGDDAAHWLSSVEHSFKSGIPVPAGENLNMTEGGSCDVAYTASGYYARS